MLADSRFWVVGSTGLEGNKGSWGDSTELVEHSSFVVEVGIHKMVAGMGRIGGIEVGTVGRVVGRRFVAVGPPVVVAHRHFPQQCFEVADNSRLDHFHPAAAKGRLPVARGVERPWSLYSSTPAASRRNTNNTFSLSFRSASESPCRLLP